MYHVDVLSGVVCKCLLGDKCPIENDLHGVDYMELIRAQEARMNMALYSHDFFNYGESFYTAMEAATANGFTRGGSPEIENAQVAILAHRESIIALLDFIGEKKDGSFKSKLMKVTAWAISNYCKSTGLEVKKFFDSQVSDRLSEGDLNNLKMSLFSQSPTLEELLSISATLWMFDYSPYRLFAKYLIFGGDYKVCGYTPSGEFNVTVYDNDLYYDEFSIDSRAIRDDVVAFDIETDTSEGFGLLPQRTQITEIVLSCSKRTTVISGDERLILEYMRDFFNSLDESTRVIGWNNECFDNIVLQTRAEFHGIEGWMGSLYAVENDTIFEPCGPTSQACGFRWHGEEHGNLTLDIFQIKIRDDLRNGVYSIASLKGFVEEHGGRPVRVDRANLHLLSDGERNVYSLSDGLCTLYAYSLVFQQLRGEIS